MSLFSESYCNLRKRLKRKNSSGPFTNRLLVRWVLMMLGGRKTRGKQDRRGHLSITFNCNIYLFLHPPGHADLCQWTQGGDEERTDQTWVQRTGCLCAVSCADHLCHTLLFYTDSVIKTEGFSLETCRSMIALMDVSSQKGVGGGRAGNSAHGGLFDSLFWLGMSSKVSQLLCWAPQYT